MTSLYDFEPSLYPSAEEAPRLMAPRTQLLCTGLRHVKAICLGLRLILGSAWRGLVYYTKLIFFRLDSV
jgi:hypothetical protein